MHTHVIILDSVFCRPGLAMVELQTVFFTGTHVCILSFDEFKGLYKLSIVKLIIQTNRKEVNKNDQGCFKKKWAAETDI
jgi:hypothetical protein